MNDFDVTNLTCPIPISDYPNVLLAHGSGGILMNQLIEKIFLAAFKNPILEQKHDASVLEPGKGKLAMTTDSYVIHPLFFPGGDIGSLAVHGTVNDLAMCGAKPLYLSAGFILEEGLPMDTLWKVVVSMAQAAKNAGVQIVTGDTKVVNKGKGDGIFINTAGIGVIEHDLSIAPASIREGDAIILSGDIARHGMAVMAVREGLEFESMITSDSAPVNAIVEKLIASDIDIHCMRDLTRGGVASALVELAKSANVHINIEEEKIPVHEDVRGACEILGLDPMYVANEGRFVCFVPEGQADKVIQIMREYSDAEEVVCIGKVSLDKKGQVTLKTSIGTTRYVDMLSGEQLPRIC
ncbi:MAG: hydrogenase expression/formation protein HypE [PVC group bacterium]|nr:hydrogenase expression/formation protein HypE [PVC group bacterium]